MTGPAASARSERSGKAVSGGRRERKSSVYDRPDSAASVSEDLMNGKSSFSEKMLRHTGESPALFPVEAEKAAGIMHDTETLSICFISDINILTLYTEKIVI